MDVDESKISRVGQIIEKCVLIDAEQRPSILMIKQLINDLVVY